MKYFELDKYEKEILNALEKGKVKSVSHFEEEKKRHQSIAKATLNKTKNINIKVSRVDLQKIKASAAEKGIPYQSLISSLLHLYSSDRLREIS